MSPHPILHTLGFATTDRVVIIHADDIGMCQATLPAFADLLDAGLVSSGAVMVPCAWFPQVAAWYRQHPAVDMGVHLTLTSEWATYRWGPVSTRAPASGLLDQEGYFPHRPTHLLAQATPDAVAAEVQAQIARAQQAGIAPTHADCHMYAGMVAPFMPHYVRLSAAAGLVPLVGRHGPHVWAGREQLLTHWETQGLPTFDHLAVMDLQSGPEERIAQAKRLFDEMPAGLTCLLLHPARDTPELRAIVPAWRYRVADYEAFLSAELRRHVRNIGIQVITYRTLQAAMGRRSQ